MTREYARVRVHQDRRGEAKGCDAASDLRNLRVGVCPGILRKGDQAVERPKFDALGHRVLPEVYGDLSWRHSVFTYSRL